jgi:hypothetical protein
MTKAKRQRQQFFSYPIKVKAKLPDTLSICRLGRGRVFGKWERDSWQKGLQKDEAAAGGSNGLLQDM